MSSMPYRRPEWTGCTAVVIASGPSLSDEQLASVHEAQRAGRCRVIAVNNTGQRAPWADAVYFGDFMAIKHYRPKMADFAGEWWTMDRNAAERFKLRHVRPEASNGLSVQRVRVNGNSGAQAVSLAACFGAKRIVLLGFDMREINGRAHWFGQHPKPLVSVQLWDEWIRKFAPMAADAKKMGIEILNATPESALRCFPVATLTEALACPT